MNKRLTYYNCIVLLLVVAFSFQTIHKGILVGDYVLHQSYYEALCVNKAKPKLHCDGKCQLAKQIQHDSNQQPTNHDHHSDRFIEFLMFFQKFEFFQFKNIKLVQPLFSFYTLVEGINFQHTILRPPIF